MTDSAEPRCWILTGSLENFRASRDRDFSLIGLKERRRRQAEEIEVGDRVVLYVTGEKAFGGIVRVTGELFEDRSPVWPGKPGKVESYPWRFDAEPVVVLDEDDLVPAEDLAPQLEHVRKWPADHWHLAFQGQIRPVSQADARLLHERLRAAAAATPLRAA